MALARTTFAISESGDNHGTGSFTTGAFTPPDNSLLVVAIYAHGTSGADISSSQTISDSVGLTWTSRALVGVAASDGLGIRVWTAPVTTGASMTITADCGAENVFKYGVHRIAYTGYDTGSPTGATATAGVSGATDDETITLSASPATTSEVVAAMGIIMGGGTQLVTPGTGWTEIYEGTSDADFSNTQSQVRTGSTSTSVVWDDIDAGTGTATHGGFLAVEIKAAAAAAGDTEDLMGQMVSV